MNAARLSILAALVVGAATGAQAQILMASGTYRIVELDEQHQRVGVALVDADRHVTQNWIYIQPTTEVKIRKLVPGGWFKDEKLNYYQFFHAVQPGSVLRVHGGRRWDGGISAKKIGIGAPTP